MRPPKRTVAFAFLYPEDDDTLPTDLSPQGQVIQSPSSLFLKHRMLFVPAGNQVSHEVSQFILVH